MSEDISRYVQVDDWIFEVKMVRAIRTKHYGEPYSATASVSLNGQSAFVDGLMTSDQAEFTRDDYQSFRKFFKQMNVEQVNFDRYKKSTLKSDSIPVSPSVKDEQVKEVVKKEAPILQLVLG